MTVPARKADQRFTFSDYLSWDDGERWELIDGVAYCMTPAPSLPHQRVSAQLVGQLVAALNGHVCTAFHAPCDVLLPLGDEPDGEQGTVVQPDFFIVRDPKKLALYERHGVGEYWIIDPVHGTVAIRVLGPDGKYGAPTVVDEGEVELAAVPGISVNLSALFPPPTERD